MKYFLTGGDLYQWDIGRKVTLALPEGETASVVEFTINNEANALVVDVNGNEAAIPNVLLQTAGGLRMWAVTVTADGRQTRRYGSAPVYSRAKPDDYIYTETEVKRYEDFEERIKALEKNGGGAVESVNGQTGAVKLTAADVGAIPAEKTGTIKSTGVLIAGDGQPHYARMEGGDGRAMFSMRDASGNIINRVSLRESETTLGQPLAVNSGGHGGKTAAEGRENLDVYSKSEVDAKIPAPYTLPTASEDIKGGVKIGEGLQMDGDVLGVKPEDKYELLSTVTVGAGGTNLITFPDIGDLSAVMACITLPVSNLLIGIFLQAYTSKGESYVVGSNYGSKDGKYSIRLELYINRGILTGTAQGNVSGWGSADVHGVNNAADLKFADKISTIRIYCPQADRNIMEGTVIKIYGVGV